MRDREREKNSWVEPELIVLVRSKPEEAVLGGCKAPDLDSGSEVSHGMCGNDGSPCSNCVELVQS